MEYRNGIVNGYIIYYYDPWNMLEKNISVSNGDLAQNETGFVYVVNGLHPFTNYSFSIAAYTIVGVGPTNFQAHAVTNESGMFS